MQNHSFSIIGLGKVGTSILKTFLNVGNALVGVSTRDEIFGGKVASEYNCLFEPIPEHILSADIIIITVNDASIKETGTDIIGKTDGVVAHTSGALSSRIFSSHKGRVSIHPVFPVYEKFMDLSGKRFTIEGDNTGLEISREMLGSINGRFSIIDADKKPLYHLASIVGSNFIASVAYLCAEIYKISGLDEDAAIEIVGETFSAMKKKGIYNALTGPVERGDTDTIRMDIEAVKDYPDVKKFILPLFELTVKLAKKKGIGDEKISGIMDVLAHYYSS